MVSKVVGDEIFILEDGRWHPTFVKGVNLGMALPGNYPSQFPTEKEDYLLWFRYIGEMHANSIRVYNVPPPVFYEAFLEYNSNPNNSKLWLIHGAWPPLGDDFFDGAYLEEYEGEMRHVVDIIHGNASFQPRPGHSGGEYQADISQYVLAYVIGMEWEPDVVYENDKKYSGITAYNGEYLRVEKGTATECFLARMCDYIVDYEYEKYGWQRPVSFTNWPTLDPIYHPTEHDPGEDIEAFMAQFKWHNDAVTVDASNILSTQLNKAGYFAAYHIYPWNPDFMNNDPYYSSYRDRQGHPNNYAGYLHDLKQHHPNIPILVAEFGVPSSRGNAHTHPQGMNHGAHTEIEQGIMDARMIEDIYEEGYAGGVVFNWMDEWWKTNWLVNAFELHSDGRDRFWHNPQDPEEYFGLLAMDSELKISVDGDVNDWAAPLYKDAVEDLMYSWGDGYDNARDLKALYLEVDPTYLYVRLDVANLDCDGDGKVDWSEVGYIIGIDTYDRERGDHQFPLNAKLGSPSGLEFAIDLRSELNARVLVDNYYSDYASPRTGKLRSQQNEDGNFTEIIVCTNRERIAEDGTVYPALYHSNSDLLYGSTDKNSSDYNTLADWYVSTQSDSIELRIPWYLLHVADPSTHLILDDDPTTRDKVETAKTTGLRVYAISYRPTGDLAVAEETGLRSNAADMMPGGQEGFTGEEDFLWEEWETPTYKERLKDSYYIMKETYGRLGIATIASFRDDAESAVSITFDDGKLNQYAYALPVLEKHDIKATFDITIALLSPERITLENAHLGQWMDWSYVTALSEGGHEIASHSVEHVSLPKLSPEEIYRNVYDSKVAIENETGRPCISFAYPFSAVSLEVKQIVEEAGYVCARSYGASYNGLSPEFYGLKSLAILKNDKPTVEEFRGWVAETVTKGKWLILMYHNVVPEDDPELVSWKDKNPEDHTNNLYPSTLDVQMQIVKDSNSWVAPMGEVACYLKERMHTKVHCEVSEDRLTVSLEDDLPNEVYNVPLTLIAYVEWEKVKVSDSAADGVYDVKDGLLIINVYPDSQVTIGKEAVEPSKPISTPTPTHTQTPTPTPTLTPTQKEILLIIAPFATTTIVLIALFAIYINRMKKSTKSCLADRNILKGEDEI